jgi:N-acetylmuramoyl-L-alanine amidase
MRPITKVIIHCSATPPSMDIGADTIRGWHVNGNKWADIGYHYVVRLDGKIEEGRGIDAVGAHTRGENTSSIGLCYVGGVGEDKQPKDTRTPEQKKTLRELTSALAVLFPEVSFHGHNEFSAKACPSFDVKSEGYGKEGLSDRPECTCG